MQLLKDLKMGITTLRKERKMKELPIRKLTFIINNGFEDSDFRSKFPNALLVTSSQSLGEIAETVFTATIDSKIFLHHPIALKRPSMQAALCSFLVEALQTKEIQLIIETHSDHMLDRARIEIAQGNIKPEDVIILYFEKKNKKIIMHQIEIDKLGNILNAPSSYREFQLKEQMDLLTA